MSVPPAPPAPPSARRTALYAVVATIALAAVVVASLATTGIFSPRSNATSPIPSCPGTPSLAGPGTPVPAGRFVLVSEILFNDTQRNGGPAPQTRISTWSQSNSTNYLYVMSQADYDALGWTSNATGNASHSAQSGPAQSYLWSSGPVTATNHTVLVGDGTWHVVLYNPGSNVASVHTVVGSCNAPDGGRPLPL